jgi:hypothetical protein
LKALSIKQPWSWLIVNGHKDIENRDWPTRFRGQVLIHAGRLFDDNVLFCEHGDLRMFTDFRLLVERNLTQEQLKAFKKSPKNWGMGGIVGIAEIVDCVAESKSPWFFGKFGFVLKNARPLPFIPLRGQLSFFEVPQDVLSQIDYGQ